MKLSEVALIVGAVDCCEFALNPGRRDIVSAGVSTPGAA